MAVSQDGPRMKGGPTDTVFGVLGMTKENAKTRTLGGLVKSAPSAAVPKDALEKHPRLIHTERGITGPAAKTHISGLHYAQVPYPGAFMAHAGHEL